jgi:hypothetical protein
MYHFNDTRVTTYNADSEIRPRIFRNFARNTHTPYTYFLDSGRIKDENGNCFTANSLNNWEHIRLNPCDNSSIQSFDLI